MPVPNSFANVTTSIPLSQLDANFNTPITLGNTAIQLGNTVSTLNNMTLANVTVSSGNVTITNVTVTTANVTTANIATAQIANVTVSGTGTFAAGSNTAPSITTSGDTNTGIFFPAADTIAFTEGGVESMRITSAGDVGIGTSTPATISNRTVLSINNASNGGALNLLVNGTETLRLLTDNSSFGYVYNIANQPLLFGTNNTERMRLDSSGNLGLGVTPSGWTLGKAIEVGTSPGNGIWGVGASNMNIVSNVYYDGAYKFAGTGSAGTLSMSGGGFAFASSTASGTAGGTISFTDILGASRGNTLYLQGASSQSGTGITFPATQNASSNANTLDDYEEGTWTPTLAGGFSSAPTSYTVQSGSYTKIGRLVYFELDIDANGATANASVITIGGLPFTVASNTRGGGFSTYQINFDTNNLDTFETVPSNTTIQVMGSDGNGRLGNAANVNINNRIRLSGCYQTT